jgi:hypothetical protein
MPFVYGWHENSSYVCIIWLFQRNENLRIDYETPRRATKQNREGEKKGSEIFFYRGKYPFAK